MISTIQTTLTFLKLKSLRKLSFAIISFLTIIALIVWVQNYFRFGNTEYYSLKLSLIYNLIIFVSFAVFTPLIEFLVRRFPIERGSLLSSGLRHLIFCITICLIHMMLCNIILYRIDLVSSIPFEPFIFKYLTRVIQFHLLIYIAVVVILSIINQSLPAKEMPSMPVDGRLVFKSNGEFRQVVGQDILWIEAFDHYQKIYTNDGYILIKDSMKNLEQNVLPENFCRVHRSYIINTSKIISITKGKRASYYAQLIDGTELRVSDSFKMRLQASLIRE